MKRASWTDLIMLRESEDEINPGVYITPERWLRFLGDVKTGAYEPRIEEGLVEIPISDFPRGLVNRCVYTTPENWTAFVRGVRQGKFDDMGAYPRQFA